MEHFAVTVALIGLVVIVASLISGAVEKSGFPLVAIFLLLGAVIGPWGLGIADVRFESPALRTIATLALALVLFSDAVSVDTRAIRARRWLVWRLLGPGTLIPAAILAAAAHALLGIDWPASAILGAALASTDPIMLRSVLRTNALSSSTRVALRLETGMNDVVLLPVVILALLFIEGAGAPMSELAPEVMRSALGLFLLGPVLGALVGWLGIIVLIRVRDRTGVRRDYESLYAIGLAFTAFAAAETVGGSGFLAAFAAGLMVSAQDVELCDCFLEYGEATSEMLLLLAFVALGTSLMWDGLRVISLPTLGFALIALGVRTAVLYPLLTGTPLSQRERAQIALLGPRGLSTLLLVLLPVFAGVSGAEQLFYISAFVVLISIVLHGTLIAIAARNRERVHTATMTVPSEILGETASHPVPPAPVATRVLALAPEGEDVDEPMLTLPELIDMRARGAGPHVLDVRAERSLSADGSIADGAVRVDALDAIRDVLALRIPKEDAIAVYCACVDDASARSVARQLRAAGWHHARALLGGWHAWNEAGLPVVARV